MARNKKNTGRDPEINVEVDIGRKTMEKIAFMDGSHDSDLRRLLIPKTMGALIKLMIRRNKDVKMLRTSNEIIDLTVTTLFAVTNGITSKNVQSSRKPTQKTHFIGFILFKVGSPLGKTDSIIIW